MPSRYTPINTELMASRHIGTPPVSGCSPKTVTRALIETAGISLGFNSDRRRVVHPHDARRRRRINTTCQLARNLPARRTLDGGARKCRKNFAPSTKHIRRKFPVPTNSASLWCRSNHSGEHHCVASFYVCSLMLPISTSPRLVFSLTKRWLA